MSILNDIKKIAKNNPNDMDLGNKIRSYIDKHRTCCDNESNYMRIPVKDSGPYGYYGIEIRCGECGSLIDFILDKS